MSPYTCKGCTRSVQARSSFRVFGFEEISLPCPIRANSFPFVIIRVERFMEHELARMIHSRSVAESAEGKSSQMRRHAERKLRPDAETIVESEICERAARSYLAFG